MFKKREQFQLEMQYVVLQHSGIDKQKILKFYDDKNNTDPSLIEFHC